MQVIEYSECMKNIIRLSILAKEYHDFMFNNNDPYLHVMSLKYVKNKKYDCMSAGVKEMCINLIEETWNNVNTSDAFYQNLLVNISCNEVMIESLQNIFIDMLVHCEDMVKKTK